MRLTVGVAGLLLGLLVACGGDDGDDHVTSPSDARRTASGIAGSFVGKVEGSDAFIGIVVLDTREALAYVCDSKTVSQWFRGNATSDGLSLAVGNSRLEANLTTSTASGTVMLGGQPALKFMAKPASDLAGLYRGTGSEGGLSHVGGWIVLASKEQRGAVVTTSSGPPASTPTRPAGLPTIAGSGALAPVQATSQQDAKVTADRIQASNLQKETIRAVLAESRNNDTGGVSTLIAGNSNLSTTKGGQATTPVATVKPVVVATAVTLQPQKLTSTGNSASLK